MKHGATETFTGEEMSFPDVCPCPTCFLSDSLCPLELLAASCLRTSLPGSITVKQMPGQCADVSGFTE